MNLKSILMDLGNTLVTKFCFLPGHVVLDLDHQLATDPNKPDGCSTAPIVAFTEWLNDMPEAQEALASMGVSWPVVQTEQTEHPVWEEVKTVFDTITGASYRGMAFRDVLWNNPQAMAAAKVLADCVAHINATP